MNNHSHVIRLRGPWTRTIDEGDDQKVTLPDRLVDQSCHRVTYARSFHRPSGLDSSIMVYLVVGQWQGGLRSLHLNETLLSETLISEVTLSETPLGGGVLQQQRMDITKLLTDFNRLSVQLSATSEGRVGLIGEVQLEIETTG